MSAMRPTAVDDIELAITGSEPEPEDAGGSRGWHRHANLAVEVGSNRLGWMPSAAATNSPLGSPFRPVPTTVQELSTLYTERGLIEATYANRLMREAVLRSSLTSADAAAAAVVDAAFTMRTDSQSSLLGESADSAGGGGGGAAPLAQEAQEKERGIYCRAWVYRDKEGNRTQVAWQAHCIFLCHLQQYSNLGDLHVVVC